MGSSIHSIADPAAHQSALGVRVDPLSAHTLEEPGHHVAGRTELVLRAIDGEPTRLQVGHTVRAAVPPADGILHPGTTRRIGAGKPDVRIVIGGQVQGHGIGGVQAVVPCKHVGVRDNSPGSALILPRLHDRHDVQLHVVAVDPILADAALAGG